MSSLGKELRVRRLLGPRQRLLLLALDHGLPAGPLPGLEDPRSLVASLRGVPLSGIIANPGIARLLVAEAAPLPPLIVHLSAGTLLGSSPSSKVLSGTVERAVALGADAVSVQIHFGSEEEPRMLEDTGDLIRDADRLGIPTLVMAYPLGATSARVDAEEVRYAARAAAELGASLVQTSHPGSAEAVHVLVRGCPVPVLVSGGPKRTDAEAFLHSVRAALAGGAAGISAGRNLFQHPDPVAFARRLAEAVFGESRRIEIAGA